MALLCITFVKIVRKEIIATGGRGCRMTIRGYVENKFDCVCQISSVYTSNTASFSLTTVIYGWHFATACILASLLCSRKKQVWHSYCAEVLRGPRGWVCSYAVILAQNWRSCTSTKQSLSGSSLLWKVSASSTDVLTEVGSQAWISAVLRISFLFTYFPEIFSNS